MFNQQSIEIPLPPPQLVGGIVKQPKLRNDKQRKPRFPRNRVVTIRCIYPVREQRCQGMIIECSKSGLMLRTRAQFEPGCVLHIFLSGLIMIGEVCFCRSAPGGLVYGIQIENRTDGVRFS